MNIYRAVYGMSIYGLIFVFLRKHFRNKSVKLMEFATVK